MKALELLTIRDRPSPNHRDRNGHRVKLLVVHSDASPSLNATIDWIAKSKAELLTLWERTPAESRPAQPWGPVSYHYSVGRTGLYFRHVVDGRAAYHAGKSDWRGETDGKGGVNDFSLGINISNKQNGRELYPGVQLDAAARLVASLCIDHQLPASAITTHYLTARPINRKKDPFPNEPTFDFMAFLGRVNAWAGRLHCDLLAP